MFLSWYEHTADRKEHLLFMKRNIKYDIGPAPLPHIHNSKEIAFGIKGKSKVFVNDKEYELGEGDIMFMDSFDRHGYAYKTGTECYIVLISSSFFDGVNNLKTLTFSTFMEKNENFSKIKEFLDFSFSVRNTESMAFNTGFVNMLISLMTSLYPHEYDNKRSRINEVLVGVMQYISEHCREDITVSALAKRFGYSPNYLSTIFNEYVGMGVRDYLNACRISEFINLKKNSPELSTCKAAELVGFRNMSTFYLAARKIKNQAPHVDLEF